MQNQPVALNQMRENQPVACDPRIGDWMQLYTGTGVGRQFWPLDPRAEEVLLPAIAHSLGMIVRYNGHCIRFLSVGEHSVHMARWVLANGGTTEEAMWALFHDAPESNGIADIIRPVKPFVQGYKGIEDAVMVAVCQQFGLPLAMPAIVKEADNRILNDEQTQNMERPPVPWSLPDHRPLGVTLQFWTPEQAEAEFLKTYWNLIEIRRH